MNIPLDVQGSYIDEWKSISSKIDNHVLAIKQMELLKEKYVEEMSKQAKEGEDVGDVPFTLGDK